MTLPALLRKAFGDAGFDLSLGSDAEWERFGISGMDASVWVLPVHRGALLAIAERPILREFKGATWTEVPLPGQAAGAVHCHTPAELYETLRRIRVLFNQLPPRPEERFARRLAAIDGTEVEVIVRQRVGQTLFREMLMEYWDGRCAVTGLEEPELLRASHAKPWKDSSDAERLDVYNGLLLAVHLDALFDAGLMTFMAEGAAEFSKQLSADSLALIAPGASTLRLGRVAAGHLPYLEHHRRHVFDRDNGDNVSPTAQYLMP